jgi:hypothetical protein
MGHVLVARFKNNGRVELGAFLVDVFCLGVKDAFFEQFDATAEYEALMEDLFASTPMATKPEAARKLVESAVAYAARLGFGPAPDYKKACRVFGGIDAGRCPDSFEFGKEGKPFYIAGPYESPAQQERIVRQLEAKCGEGNYEYLAGMRAEDLEENEDHEEPGEPSGVLSQEDRQRFLEDLKEATGQEITLSQDGPKISDRLMKIAEHFLDESSCSEELKGLAFITALAWNLTAHAPKSVLAEIKERCDAAPLEIRWIIQEMAERKKEFYPKDTRFVVQADIVKPPSGGAPVFVAGAIRQEGATVG